jgi:hypothetical protein
VLPAPIAKPTYAGCGAHIEEVLGDAARPAMHKERRNRVPLIDGISQTASLDRLAGLWNLTTRWDGAPR